MNPDVSLLVLWADVFVALISHRDVLASWISEIVEGTADCVKE